MSEQHNEPLSPTFTKLLDAYLEALTGDVEIDDDAAIRLNALLRQGKIPKPVDIDAALRPPKENDYRTENAS